jgi:hypothetical protein
VIARSRGLALIMLAVTLLALAGGDIAFRSRNLPREQQWPPAVTGDFKTISLQVDQSSDSWFVAPSEHVKHLFEDSGLFWRIIDGPPSQECDRDVHVKVSSSYRPSPWYTGVVFFFTGWIIPTRSGTWRVEVEIEVMDRDGEFLGAVSVSEKESTWGSILFVPVAPFVSHGSFTQLYSDAVRGAIDKADQQGLF